MINQKKPVHGILHITYIPFIELWGDRLGVAVSGEQWTQGPQCVAGQEQCDPRG